MADERSENAFSAFPAISNEDRAMNSGIFSWRPSADGANRADSCSVESIIIVVAGGQDVPGRVARGLLLAGELRDMPDDAKLGLAVGVTLVIVVAVVFFRKEPPFLDPAAATIAKPIPTATPPVPATPAERHISTTGRVREAVLSETTAEERQHTVRAGETLFSLAQRYYGDGDKSALIFQVNRQRLDSASELPAGTILVIPELSHSPGQAADNP